MSSNLHMVRDLKKNNFLVFKKQDRSLKENTTHNDANDNFK